MEQVEGQDVVSFHQMTQIDRQIADVQVSHGGRCPHEIETTRILFSVHVVKQSQAVALPVMGRVALVDMM